MESDTGRSRQGMGAVTGIIWAPLAQLQRRTVMTLRQVVVNRGYYDQKRASFGLLTAAT